MSEKSSTMLQKLKQFFGWPTFNAPAEYQYIPGADEDLSRIAQDMHKVLQDFQRVLDREAAREQPKEA